MLNKNTFYILATIIFAFLGVHFSLATSENALKQESSLSTTSEGNPQSKILALIDQGREAHIDELIRYASSPDESLRYLAIWALAEISDPTSNNPKIEDAFLSKLKDEAPWIKIAAIEGLAKVHLKKRMAKIYPDKRFIKPLLSLSKDPDPYIRLAIVHTLFSWGNDPKVKANRIAAAEDEIWFVRRKAISGHSPIGYYGAREPQIYIDALKDKDPYIRINALRQLLPYKEIALEYFVKHETDPEEVVAIEASRMIAQLLGSNDSNDSEVLAKARSNLDKKTSIKTKPKSLKEAQIRFRTGNREDKISAVLSMTWTNPAKAVDFLLAASQDKYHSRVRYASLHALNQMDFTVPRNIDAVRKRYFEVLTDPDPFIRKQAVIGISSIPAGIEAYPVLKTLTEAGLKEKNPFVREIIVKKLRRDPSWRAVLTQFWDDPFFEVRRESFEGITLSCFRDEIPRFLKFLDDPKHIVRFHAAMILGLDRSDVVAKLRDRRDNDPHKEVRQIAEQSLRQIVNRRKSDLDYYEMHPCK